MRAFIFSLFFLSSILSAQSIDDLLHEADHILQNQGQKPANTDSKKPARTRKKKIEADDSENAVTNESAKPTQPTLTKLIEETQPADLKGVVELDAKAAQLSAERQRRAYASIGVLFGVNQLKEGYGFEKNEDHFTTEPSSLRGAAIEIESSAINFSGTDLGYRFGATLGYYRGDVDVERQGVFNERRDYAYTMVPGDAFARLAWLPVSWFEIAAHGGVAMELLQQNGVENTDTSSMVCFGPLLGAQLRWIPFERMSVFALAEKKGFTAKASQSSVAGNHYALGTSFNLFL